ncbi:MAG: hypothetical protein KGZ49_04290 [Syntrophaceae bacterium]|nr:hypothetical protein [Syntrophaceae bacterium]
METSNNFEKLKWLKDGCNWLVTITSGVIVFSATFYTDIIGECPQKIWLVLLGWGFLLFSLLAGVICYFSTFKKVLKEDYKLEHCSWVGISYSFMLLSFLFGMISLGIFIIYNKL